MTTKIQVRGSVLIQVIFPCALLSTEKVGTLHTLFLRCLCLSCIDLLGLRLAPGGQQGETEGGRREPSLPAPASGRPERSTGAAGAGGGALALSSSLFLYHLWVVLLYPFCPLRPPSLFFFFPPSCF